MEIVIENGIELEKHTSYYGSGEIRFEQYFLNNKLHRENSPAFIGYFKNGNIDYEYYHIDDKRHRENGPAVIYYHKNSNVKQEWYYLNGIEITDELQLMVIKGLSKV